MERSRRRAATFPRSKAATEFRLARARRASGYFFTQRQDVPGECSCESSRRANEEIAITEPAAQQQQPFHSGKDEHISEKESDECHG